MGERYFRNEKKSRCCLDCHYLSKYHQLKALLEGGETVFVTWNEKERLNLSVEPGKDWRSICAKEEWNEEEKRNMDDTIKRDRSKCVSFANYEKESGLSRILCN